MDYMHTFYRGIGYRSPWEAQWACWLDYQGVKYTYEKGGHKEDDNCYLPDFKVQCFDSGFPTLNSASYVLCLEPKGNTYADGFADKARVMRTGLEILLLNEIAETHNGIPVHNKDKCYYYDPVMDEYVYPCVNEYGMLYLVTKDTACLHQDDLRRAEDAYEHVRLYNFETERRLEHEHIIVPQPALTRPVPEQAIVNRPCSVKESWACINRKPPKHKEA